MNDRRTCSNHSHSLRAAKVTGTVKCPECGRLLHGCPKDKCSRCFNYRAGCTCPIPADPMDDLYNVGASKPLGYLPLKTIRSCGFTPGQIASDLESHQLQTRFCTTIRNRPFRKDSMWTHTVTGLIIISMLTGRASNDKHASRDAPSLYHRSDCIWLDGGYRFWGARLRLVASACEVRSASAATLATCRRKDGALGRWSAGLALHSFLDSHRQG